MKVLPHSKPIFTVVGKGIKVEKIKNPSKDQIDKLHELYLDELRKLFEEHKDKYSEKSTYLEII
jgi:hypothetical protein